LRKECLSAVTGVPLVCAGAEATCKGAAAPTAGDGVPTAADVVGDLDDAEVRLCRLAAADPPGDPEERRKRIVYKNLISDKERSA